MAVQNKRASAEALALSNFKVGPMIQSVNVLQ